MAYSRSSMLTEMRKFMDINHGSFEGFPSSPSDFAAKMKTAYNAAATVAEDISTDVPAAVNDSSFESTLAGLGNNESASGAASTWGDAFVGYWTAVAFNVGALVAGTGSPCPNAGGNGIFGVETTSLVTSALKTTLQGLLTTEFGSNSGDSDAKMNALADHFETATKADITVLITGLDTTPTPTGPLPITNTCTVF